MMTVDINYTDKMKIFQLQESNSPNLNEIQPQ